uniref:Dihydroorotate dehydrogenase (quinone), mitochondrial n=1 Tax=Paulinella chromatophora TaxID=39717 RepID=B1X4C5_PAUCH|nr:dihydroorotate dehydrogenase [Paulinella chromatophora]ACB42794.1 dihydroorotate dehydrogenase [Paulinella chromatophora]
MLSQKFKNSKLYDNLINASLSKDDGLNPEQLSHLSLTILKLTCKWRRYKLVANALDRVASEFQRKDLRLGQNLFGCYFTNPIGLAAGFDKNGVTAGILDRFGFGFAELGTVTWHSQLGNCRPRLLRLSFEKAALNKMGFNNQGAQIVKSNLESQNLNKKGSRPAILGINLGKSKITALDWAYYDYASSLELLAPLLDYGVINVSSPNTPGLRTLQSVDQLKALLIRLRELPIRIPILVKIAPDLRNEDIDNIAKLAYNEGLAGIIAVNTSLDRLALKGRYLTQMGCKITKEFGGLSGEPIADRALEVIKRLRGAGDLTIPLIGVGGISSPRTAWERISAGASLIQIYTGWIYQGPLLVPKILEGLQSQLDRHGLSKLSDVVGSNMPWI